MPPTEPLRRPAVRLALLALGACLAACTGTQRETSETVDSGVASVALDAPIAAGGDTTNVTPASSSAAPSATIRPPVPARRLPPLADTIAQRLVFLPVVQDWFAAGARNKRLMVDLGRVDIDLKKEPARIAAFGVAAAARSPFPVGTRLRLRGAWGSDDATISGFEAYNGRILATLATSPLVDSTAAATDPLVASAQRVTEPSPAAPASCDRTADSTLVGRLTRLARSTEDEMRAAPDQPIYPRLKAALKARRSMAAGCFGAARGIVVVTLYAGDYEWVRERVLLVGDSTVKKLTVRDLRFRAHEALHALDADGDGVDDLAARAWTPRGGGTVILSLVDGARLERLAAGFAWER